MKRSAAQNRALHLWLEQVCESLNAAGLDIRTTLRHDIEHPWNPQAAKDYLWKPVQLAVTGTERTSEAERNEYAEVYEVLNRHMGEKLGIHVPWPCEETLSEERTAIGRDGGIDTLRRPAPAGFLGNSNNGVDG